MRVNACARACFFSFLQDHRGNGRISSAHDRSSELEGVIRRVLGHASSPRHYDPVFLVYSAALFQTLDVFVT